MYLEISGRQTGKTSRAIDFAINVAKEGKTVSFVVHDQRVVQRIRDVIEKKTHYSTSRLILVTSRDVHISLPGIKQLPFDWYVYDEFDYNPNLTLRCIKPNSYFVTTPRYIRTKEQRKLPSNDILYTLVRKKRGKYINHGYASVHAPSCSLPYNELLGTWSDSQLTN